ncbi:MAG: TIGR03435 family protein [Bryobacteraceae bacterium]
MVKTSAIAILMILASHGALAQSATTPPAFEVASIKPASLQEPGRVSTRMSSDAGMLRYTNVSVSDVIGQAYRVQQNQISGPAWLATERFDIAAKIPAGAAKDQIPRMFQALLAERFKLAFHREKKELPIYTLVAAKSGTKLQKAESLTGLSIGTNPNGAHVTGQVSIQWLSDYLSTRLGREVLDQTGLDGVYAVALTLVPDPAEEQGSLNGSAPAAPGPSLFTALQEQLGLKLVATRGPVEVLVIDHVEKSPTEN